jgi:hypothetical protein
MAGARLNLRSCLNLTVLKCRDASHVSPACTFLNLITYKAACPMGDACDASLHKNFLNKIKQVLKCNSWLYLNINPA